LSSLSRCAMSGSCSLFCLLTPRRSPLFPYTTLFRSQALQVGAPDDADDERGLEPGMDRARDLEAEVDLGVGGRTDADVRPRVGRSEEHTSELQSRFDLVCRLLLEKKKYTSNKTPSMQ